MYRPIIVAAIVLGLAGVPARAVPVLVADADGIGVDDTTSGFEWLKLPLTEGLSINEAAAGPYGTAGFAVATTAQVHQLLVDAGFAPVNDASFITFDGGTLATFFISVFGATSANFTEGFTKASATSLFADVAVVGVTGQSQADAPGATLPFAGAFDSTFGPYGVWMLRDSAAAADVPEPGTAALLGAGISLLALRRRR